MNTTELIKLLQDHEKGFTGRSREVSFYFTTSKGKRRFVGEPEIRYGSSGDGVFGAELSLEIIDKDGLYLWDKLMSGDEG